MSTNDYKRFIEKVDFLKDIVSCMEDKFPDDFEDIRKGIEAKVVNLSIQNGQRERKEYEKKWENEDHQNDKKDTN